MSRPTKQSIDYFPLDTNFDDKIDLFIAEMGAVGLGVLITTWQLIYKNEGYYIPFSDDTVLLIKQRLSLPPEIVRESISCCIRRGIFNQAMAEKYKILTSRAIQKRYFLIAKKKKIVNVIQNYILDGVSVGENSNTIRIHSNGNAIKEKEKEKEKEKGEGRNRKLPHEWPDGFLLSDRMRTYAVNAGVMSPEKEFERFESKAKAKGYKYKDWEAAWRNWCLSDFTKKGHPGEEFLT